MQDVVAQLRRVAAAAIASLPLALPLQPALAIPEAEAIKKLAVIPVFLLTVFGKGEKDNLTQGERNALRSLTGSLRESLSAR